MNSGSETVTCANVLPAASNIAKLKIVFFIIVYLFDNVVIGVFLIFMLVLLSSDKYRLPYST